MPKMYVFADLHGKQEYFMENVEAILKEGDCIFIAGDAGKGFLDGRYFPESMFLEYIGKKYKVFLVDGNHERFDQLDSCPLTEAFGGRVHELATNVYHLMRGEIYVIEGVRILVMGGGCSLDKEWRTEGISWFPQEMPSPEERENCLANLKKVDYRVDVIITHTGPSRALMSLNSMFRDIKPLMPEEAPLNAFLDTLEEYASYERWFFDHMHVDYDFGNGQYVLYEDVRDLVTGEVIASFDRRKEEYR